MGRHIFGKRGVTMLELLIVMVIIGILVGLLVPATIKMRKAAADTKVRSARITLRNAVLSFHAEYGIWPVGDQVEKASFSSSSVIVQLRPDGGKNAKKKLFWEGEDKITKLDGAEYQVTINPLPDALKPIGAVDDFDSRYTVSFK